MDSASYATAGVNIDAGNLFTEMIKERVAAAWPDTGQEIGGFAGGGMIPNGATHFVGGIDGTGTKIILAALLGRFEGIGKDAVAMATVDTYVAGGQVAAIWDVINTGKLVPDLHINIIDSIIDACRLAGCRLLGGETAELPDMFKHEWITNLDVCALGFPDDSRQYSPIKPGQTVYSWRSDGPASNGYSLIRKVFKLNQDGPAKVRQRLERRWPSLDAPLGDVLLRPTPIWIKQIETQRVHRWVNFAGHAHITGGGLIENIPRMLPDNCKVVIDRSTWPRPPIFPLIQREGSVEDAEMDRTFNQGVMMVSIVSDEGHNPDTPNCIPIGQVEARKSNEPQVQLTNAYNDA